MTTFKESNVARHASGAPLSQGGQFAPLDKTEPAETLTAEGAEKNRLDILADDVENAYRALDEAYDAAAASVAHHSWAVITDAHPDAEHLVVECDLDGRPFVVSVCDAHGNVLADEDDDAVDRVNTAARWAFDQRDVDPWGSLLEEGGTWRPRDAVNEN